MNQWHHWQLSWDQDGNVELLLEVADRSANVLHREVLDEFEDVLDRLAAMEPPGVILGTRPGRAFSVGADVREFAGLRSRDEALRMLRRGQELFERWSQLECPTAAAMRGYCLGGGLELALACDYRVAEYQPDGRIGLPEVRLGIHPGYGGTVRLAEVVGDVQALQLCVMGKSLTVAQARAVDLVDLMVSSRHLHAAARLLLKHGEKPRRAPLLQRLPHWPAFRWPVAAVYLHLIRKHLPKHQYPAPYRMLAHWQRMSSKRAEALRQEAESVSVLCERPQTRQMVRAFLLREELKRPYPKDDAVAHVHVAGAGAMGADIACWCAMQGLRVTLHDIDAAGLGRAVRRAHRRILRRGYDIREAMDLLQPDPQGAGVASADVVIEAIVEKREAKQELFRTLEARLKPDALLATNTSSLPLGELAGALRDPERLVGIHFFNPVHRIKLVEIIHHGAGQEARLRRAGGFVRRINRLPVAVRSAPGFMVNRILMPYVLEAMLMREEGVPAATIDRAATEFGMPVGPLELADLVGLDICMAAGAVLEEAYGLEVPKVLKELVAAGDLGFKTERGFYKWSDSDKRGRRGRTPPPGCIERLVLSMVRAAVHCLHDGVVERADTIDAGMILATGFAPHLGGPLQMVRTEGADNMRRRLEELEKHCGPRFAPGPGWDAEQLRSAPV